MSFALPQGLWFLLPLAVRQRWWDETDYGRDPDSASEELRKLIEKYRTE